jgi:DnaK suppressor protein
MVSPTLLKGVGVSVAKPSKKAANTKKAAKPAPKVKTVSKSTTKTASKGAARTMKPVKSTSTKAAPKLAPITKATTKARPVPAASKPAPVPVGSKSAPGSKNSVVKPSNGKPVKPEPQIIPRPIFSGKPGKNQAGLSTKELEGFRDLLLQKRRELVGDMYSMEREALQRGSENLSNLPLHMADMGTDNYEQEFTLGLMEKDRQLLREINTALSKIVNGTYGICEGTGKPIAKARLEVQPWAKYSIEHARKLENRGVR